MLEQDVRMSRTMTTKIPENLGVCFFIGLSYQCINHLYNFFALENTNKNNATIESYKINLNKQLTTYNKPKTDISNLPGAIFKTTKYLK